MKKTLLFIAVVSAFSFASCKKDHTCTCTDSTTGATAQVTIYPSSTKANAQANCLSSTTAGVTTTCTLK